MKLQQNKKSAIDFYKMSYNGNPRQAVERYVGKEYIQHNPLVGDGIEPFISYFEKMAKEYTLKINELTAGSFNYYYDHFLNFRHGPKSVISKKSIILFNTSDGICKKYEDDLVKELENDVNEPIVEIFPYDAQQNELENALIFSKFIFETMQAFSCKLLNIEALLQMFGSMDRFKNAGEA